MVIADCRKSLGLGLGLGLSLSLSLSFGLGLQESFARCRVSAIAATQPTFGQSLLMAIRQDCSLN